MQPEILWKETLWVNAFRIGSATVIWFFITSLMGQTEAATSMYALPAVYVALVGVILLLRYIPNPISWFLELMALILILPGDPILFIVRLIWPQVVPLAYYSPLNFVYFLYVKSI